jgi:hypothetical protein
MTHEAAHYRALVKKAAGLLRPGEDMGLAIEAADMALRMERQQKQGQEAVAILDKALADLQPMRDVALSLLDENDGRPRPTSWQAATALLSPDFLPATELLGQGTGAVTTADPSPDPSPQAGKVKPKGGRRGKGRRRLPKRLRVRLEWLRGLQEDRVSRGLRPDPLIEKELRAYPNLRRPT